MLGRILGVCLIFREEVYTKKYQIFPVALGADQNGGGTNQR